jgi:D-serine deaminase-like pyridoxal phosphate-dependent protein
MSNRGVFSRRNVLLGAGAFAAAGVLLSREADHGGPHDGYFSELSNALRAAAVAQPVLIVDRARLRRNIAAATEMLRAKRLPLRVVVKSLPSTRLIDEIAAGMNSSRFIAFNGPMLLETAKRGADIDVLLGKPLPIQAARQFYDAMLSGAAAYAEPQWLIDSPDRLQQYAQLARERDRPLRVNFEVDVGLHRGGAPEPQALQDWIRLAQAEPKIEVSGLMGYDAHVPRMPAVDSAWRSSQTIYSAAVEVVRSAFGDRTDRMTLNGAGSPTYAMHAKGTHANEVAVGSAFVKPVDFDLETLAHHEPATFIATPVIKALDQVQVPGLERLTGMRRFMDPNTSRAFFIHGGHWLARPESPPGLEYSSLYGRSSNQELLMGSSRVGLQPDDYVFMRPTQSEAVFLQFGDILVYEGSAITERWPTFPVSA